MQNQDLIFILKSNYIYECNADINQQSTNEYKFGGSVTSPLIQKMHSEKTCDFLIREWTSKKIKKKHIYHDKHLYCT